MRIWRAAFAVGIDQRAAPEHDLVVRPHSAVCVSSDLDAAAGGGDLPESMVPCRQKPTQRPSGEERVVARSVLGRALVSNPESLDEEPLPRRRGPEDEVRPVTRGRKDEERNQIRFSFRRVTGSSDRSVRPLADRRASQEPTLVTSAARTAGPGPEEVAG
jgi:hypothetical protein